MAFDSLLRRTPLERHIRRVTNVSLLAFWRSQALRKRIVLKAFFSNWRDSGRSSNNPWLIPREYLKLWSVWPIFVGALGFATIFHDFDFQCALIQRSYPSVSSSTVCQKQKWGNVCKRNTPLYNFLSTVEKYFLWKIYKNWQQKRHNFISTFESRRRRFPNVSKQFRETVLSHVPSTTPLVR